MARSAQTLYFCSECGHESSKWMGQCPACKEWNTFTQAPSIPKKRGIGGAPQRQSTGGEKRCVPVSVSEIDTADGERFSTGFSEFNRVLGGGIVRGSLILMGGDPGIGKSTLILQVCASIASDSKSKNVLYISGEESLKQIKLRADRIGKCPDSLKILCETDIDTIMDTVISLKPDIIVIDSIQTMYSSGADSAPGSPAQVRECTMALMRLAKEESVSVIVIGHVTKEGVVAGPRLLEHMVDTVLYLEGEKNASYRILRGVKNRFGATNEIGVFEMSGGGLAQVLNPSAHLLNGRAEDARGSVITCLMEGTRPIMMEVQALVTRSDFGIPRRTASGTDYNRVNLLMAVMEKRSGLRLSGFDAYVNIAGGMKAVEPAIDLAIVMALAGSFKNKELPAATVCFGEVGLSGEVRGVTGIKKRISEAEKLNFEACIIPEVCLKEADINNKKIKIIGVKNIKEAIDMLG